MAEDFERDKRRAAALDASWELDRDEWLAAAELGQDVVYNRGVAGRAESIAELNYRRDRELAEAKEREQQRRKRAIEDELRRRAQRRLEGS